MRTARRSTLSVFSSTPLLGPSTYVRGKLGNQEGQLRMIPHQPLDTLWMRLRLGLDPFSPKRHELVHIAPESFRMRIAKVIGNVAEQLGS
jgi:hypothetical protein